MHIILFFFITLKSFFSFFFFFNDTATTEIYTLSLHDALPIYSDARAVHRRALALQTLLARPPSSSRSEEHTSELQSRPHLVCRLLLEKKKKKYDTPYNAGSNTT